MTMFYARRGGEFLVNTTTTGSQEAAAVAALAGGGFVAVWADSSNLTGDNSSYGVVAQLFDANGAKVGGEFLVNTTTFNVQGPPRVAGLPSGHFVVTWTDQSASGGDTSSAAVRGQLFDANGAKVGAEFLINTAVTNAQNDSVVTGLTGGGFVVTWTDNSGVGGDSSSTGVKAQIFDANGAKVGGEILVNTTTALAQNASAVTALAGGGFAVSWTDATGDGSGTGIRLQIFDASGAKVGGEVLANTATNQNQINSEIAALSGGGLVVVWQDFSLAGGDSDQSGIKAQMFDASGAKVGTEILVNTTIEGLQRLPVVKGLPGGGFIVTWDTPAAPGNTPDVAAQVFDASGNKVGGEFMVNSVVHSGQSAPVLAVLNSGDVAILWNDTSLTPPEAPGGGFAIRGQLITLTDTAPNDIALSITSLPETAREDAPIATLSSGPGLNTTYSYSIVSDSSGGAFGIVGNELVVLDNTLLDFEAAPTVDLRIRTTDVNGNSYEETLQLQMTDSPEGDFVGGSEFVVNTTTADNQSEPVLVELAGGRLLVLWTNSDASGTTISGRGRIYDLDGNPLTGEFEAAYGAAAAFPGGGFIVASVRPDGDGSGIFLNTYNSNGDPAGFAMFGAFYNQNTFGDQGQPSWAVNPDGRFILTWTDFFGTGVDADVKARTSLMTLNGGSFGNEFLVPTNGLGVQQSPDVTILESGNTVITWLTDGVLKAQVFIGTSRIGSEFTVTADSPAAEPVVATLAGGGFVIVWHRDSTLTDLSAQIFDAAGAKVGDEILIDAQGVSRVGSVEVSALESGGFVVSWAGFDNVGTNDPGIRAQVFDSTGGTVGQQIVVNTVTAGEQLHAATLALSNGRIVVAWTDASGQGGDASGLAVKARIFDPGVAPLPSTGDDVLAGTAGDDSINGLAGNDVLTGFGGNDVLDGGAGNDRTQGGAGDDSHIVDSAGDTVVEGAGQGFDRVFASATFRLNTGAEVELLTLDQSGTAALDLAGNEFGQTIFGNEGVNSLEGMGGNDILWGIGGDDVLDGGTGGDVLIGGAGNDVYVVDSFFDAVLEGVGQGSDRILVTSSYRLSAGAEVELLTVADQTSTTAIDIAGSDFAQSIFGNDGANSLEGFGGNDQLWGLAGNDVLDGGAGDDVVIGADGDDIYAVDGFNDAIFDGAGQGNDRLLAYGSYRLGAAVEIELMSTGNQFDNVAIDLMGNGFNQIIFGNNGVNTLEGLGGTDTLWGLNGNDILDGGSGDDFTRGGLGDDTYAVDSAGDQIFETAGEGSDRVYAYTSYTLAGGVEVEQVSVYDQLSVDAIDLTGNEFGQVLFGNETGNRLSGGGGNDTLWGLGGDDTLDGGSGTDALVGGNGADVFAFTAAVTADNADTIFGYVAADDTIQLDDAVFTGLAVGALNASAFVTGTTAQDADDRIIYDSATGNLFFDADGNGAGAAVLFATLQGAPTVTATEFVVI
jgi:Ca2+-binding RTX toxin-like protein